MIMEVDGMSRVEDCVVLCFVLFCFLFLFL
jgi:hypothetical protein